MSVVRVRYFAAARYVVGVAEETVEASSLLRLCEQLAQRSEEIKVVVDRCTFLVDGRRVTPSDQVLPPGCTVDVLPPFAGG